MTSAQFGTLELPATTNPEVKIPLNHANGCNDVDLVAELDACDIKA
jgi:hypothetical protein